MNERWGNAAITHRLFIRFGLFAGNREQIGFNHNGQLIVGEAGHRERDAITVLIQPFDVVRRVIIARFGVNEGFESVQKPAESDGCPKRGGDLLNC